MLGNKFPLVEGRDAAAAFRASIAKASTMDETGYA